MPIFSKEKRRVYARKVKGFWQEFSRNKIGLFGIGILISYVIVAIFTPYISPERPASLDYWPPRAASMWAMPQWVAVFPQFQDLSPTFNIPLTKNVTMVNSTSTDRATLQFDEEALNITFHADAEGQQGKILLHLATFDYLYAPTPEFKLTTLHYETSDETRYELTVFLTTEEQNKNWEELLEDPTKACLYTHKATGARPTVDKRVTSGPLYSGLLNKELFSWKYPSDLAKWILLRASKLLFSEKGKYSVYLETTFKARASSSNCKLHLNSGNLKFYGAVYGTLGTDRVGHDVWAQLVYGVRISLLVGTTAAIIASTLGIMFGVTAGYLGGKTDQIIMRGVDVLLCLPVLPILLILAAYYSFNVYYIILLIAIFGWQGLSRIVRSRVLSLKEMPFVESARAAGASPGYIITRHLIPNVLPVVMAAMVLAVPGAILTEAALSFLGFGDPAVPTWGRMLYRARTQGGFGALAWWYVIPPGLAITFLCVAFVFIGFALDQIVNPRLRRRR